MGLSLFLEHAHTRAALRLLAPGAASIDILDPDSLITVLFEETCDRLFVETVAVFIFGIAGANNHRINKVTQE